MQCTVEYGSPWAQVALERSIYGYSELSYKDKILTKYWIFDTKKVKYLIKNFIGYILK